MDILVGFLLLTLEFRVFGFNYPNYVEHNVNRVEVVNYNDMGGSGKCPKIKQPLCGTNGKQFIYFENKCEFEVKNYELLVQGLMEYYECPLSFCKTGCPKCNSANDPVCAVNGLTGEITEFRNPCELQRRICTTQQDWEIVDSYECNSVKTNNNLHRSSQISTNFECPEYCTLEYQPVCARFMNLVKEFSNECQLKASICQTKQKWNIVRKGPCQLSNYNIAAESSPIFVTSRNEDWHLLKNRRPNWKAGNNAEANINLVSERLKCSQICITEYGPVCARLHNELKEFSSNCQLEKTICETNEKWKIVNLGACVSGSSSGLSSLKSSCPKFCSLIYEPVCAKVKNKLREFSNKCVLENWNCETNETWTVVKVGHCFSNSLHSLLPSTACSQFCTNEYKPVCAKFGSKLGEFLNRCELQKASCKTNTNWQIFKKGRCPLLSELKGPCPYLCTKEFNPVCAKYNGKLREFFNSCEFQKHICETNIDWKLFNEGPCVENSCDDEILDPICAINDSKTKTFNNTCQLTKENTSTGNYWSILHKGVFNSSDTLNATTEMSYTAPAQAETTSQPKSTIALETTPITTPNPEFVTTVTMKSTNKIQDVTQELKTTTPTFITETKTIVYETSSESIREEQSTEYNNQHFNYDTASSFDDSSFSSTIVNIDNSEENFKEYSKEDSSYTGWNSSSTNISKLNATTAATITTTDIPLTTTAIVAGDENVSDEVGEKVESITEKRNYVSTSSDTNKSNYSYVWHKLNATTVATNTADDIGLSTTAKYYSLKPSNIISKENGLEEVEETEEDSKEYHTENVNYDTSSSYEGYSSSSTSSSTHKSRYTTQKLETTTTILSSTTEIPITTTAPFTNHYYRSQELKEKDENISKEENINYNESSNYEGSIAGSTSSSSYEEDLGDDTYTSRPYEIQSSENNFNSNRYNGNSSADSYDIKKQYGSDMTKDLISGKNLKTATEKSNSREEYHNVPIKSHKQKTHFTNSKVTQSISDKHALEKLLAISKRIINTGNLGKLGKNYRSNQNVSSNENVNTALEFFDGNNLVKLIEKHIQTLLDEANYGDSSEESYSDEKDTVSTNDRLQKSHVNRSSKEYNKSLNGNNSSEDNQKVTYASSYGSPTTVNKNDTNSDAYSGAQNQKEFNQYINKNNNNKNNSVQSTENKSKFTNETESNLKVYKTDLSKSDDVEKSNETLLRQTLITVGGETTTSSRAYEKTTAHLNNTKFEPNNSKKNFTITKKGEIYNGAVYKAPVYEAPTYNFIYTAPKHAMVPLYYHGLGSNYASPEGRVVNAKHFVPILINQTNAEIDPLQFLPSWAAIGGGFIDSKDYQNNISISKQKLRSANNRHSTSQSDQLGLQLNHNNQLIANKILPLLPPEQFISALPASHSNFLRQTSNLSLPRRNKEFENNQNIKEYHNSSPEMNKVKESSLPVPLRPSPVFMPIPHLQHSTQSKPPDEVNIPFQRRKEETKTATVPYIHDDVPVQFPTSYDSVPLNPANSPQISYNSTLLNQILETLKIILH